MYSQNPVFIPGPTNIPDRLRAAMSMQTIDHDKYEVSFGVGLGEMAGKAFRIGHLGSMSDVMALAGLAAMEMAMRDLDYPIKLGSGVVAAQEYYRTTKGLALAKAA